VRNIDHYGIPREFLRSIDVYQTLCIAHEYSNIVHLTSESDGFRLQRKPFQRYVSDPADFALATRRASNGYTSIMFNRHQLVVRHIKRTVYGFRSNTRYRQHANDFIPRGPVSLGPSTNVGLLVDPKRKSPIVRVKSTMQPPPPISQRVLISAVATKHVPGAKLQNAPLRIFNLKT
jgi:hypothetical protein